MPDTMVDVGARLLAGCMALTSGETLLVVTDPGTREIGEALCEGGARLGAKSILMVIPPTGRHGAEPPPAVAEAMKLVDVVVCPTQHSLTHTQARFEAVAAGVRMATMPGITHDIFFEGAISADYEAVAAVTRRYTDLLSAAKEARIVKAGNELILPIEGRRAVASTGLYRQPGESGNLPSGEAYIAPVEGGSHGELIVDGSLVGFGKLDAPLLMRIEKGLLVAADGPVGARFLQMLDESPDGRNVGELGVGTNDRARLSGVVLEDEKVYGTVHVAFGDNHTFGGNTRAGVHMDGVILRPDLYLDGKLVVSGGKLLG